MHVRWIIGECKTTSTYATKRCLQVYQVETRNIWALSSSDEPEPSPLLAAGTGLAAAVHRKHENNGFLFVWFRFFGIGNKNHKWTILYTIKGLDRWYIHEDIAKLVVCWTTDHLEKKTAVKTGGNCLPPSYSRTRLNSESGHFRRNPPAEVACFFFVHGGV